MEPPPALPRLATAPPHHRHPTTTLPDLEVLKLGDINFAISKALPPALFGAPALRRLCLATNSKVQVSVCAGMASRFAGGLARRACSCCLAGRCFCFGTLRPALPPLLRRGGRTLGQALSTITPPTTHYSFQVRKPEIELLLSMPRLEYLSLGVRMAPGVRKALQAAAPQLQLVQP